MGEKEKNNHKIYNRIVVNKSLLGGLKPIASSRFQVLIIILRKRALWRSLEYLIYKYYKHCVYAYNHYCITYKL